MLVATNWFIFIYAINTNRVLQASLGYFINPLVSVLLGVVFLRERLQALKIMAVLLAAIGTVNLALSYGKFPWISLVLAFSFGFYGLLRKMVRVESVNGLFIETSLIFPLAFCYLFFRGVKGDGAFGVIDWQTTLLLLLAGAITTFPLVWFTCATRRLQYATIGILQYLAPTLQFLLAVFYYKEPFSVTYIITFCFIWAGLGIFMTDSIVTVLYYIQRIHSTSTDWQSRKLFTQCPLQPLKCFIHYRFCNSKIQPHKSTTLSTKTKSCI
jgi:chloramphenicol-sensitive protein RarD